MRRNIGLILGLLFLLLAWAGPLPHLAQSAFYGHMIMHMLVVAVAAPLLALGIIGSKYDPTLNSPLLFAPIPAAVGELIIVWAWHAPRLHFFARHSSWGLLMEQGMFLLAGIWVWLSSFGNKAAGVIGLLLTSMHMTFLGALLSLSTRPLYIHHDLNDQHIGGVIMLIVGGISYLTGGLWLTLKLLKEKKYEELA